MKGFKKAFTLIEVSLFLGLTGFLMIGLIVGANVSISRQRYNDSVNSFAEYLRGAYTDVLNVSNNKVPSSETGGEDAGRTNKAVYGLLITFNEPSVDKSTIYTYSVVGDAVNSATIQNSGTTLDILRGLNIEIVPESEPTALLNSAQPYQTASFIVPWEASIERPDGSAYQGALLIVRSPANGAVHTYSWNASVATANYISIQSSIKDAAANVRTLTGILLQNILENGKEEQVDFCIDSPDNNYGVRRDVRIFPNASNASFVEMIALDSNDNRCRGSSFSGNAPGDTSDDEEILIEEEFEEEIEEAPANW